MDAPSYKKKTSAANSDPYVKRQAEYDRQLAEAYRKWTDPMSSAELQELKDHKVDKPQISYVVKGVAKKDAAEWSAASYETDYAAIIDGEDESELVHPAKLDAVDAVRHLIAELMTHGKPRLTLECLALVFGLWGNLGDSLTDIGKRHGVSPQAVSERCIALCKKFGTPVPGGMHSKKAKNSTKPGKKRKK
jgi:hypothetical protein